MTTVTVKVEIKSRWDSSKILFSADVSADIDERYRLRAALTMALEAGANLADAYLAGAYLAGANLAGAYLAGAYLAGANLAGAYLADAYLAGANLAGAYLAGANLAGAYLAGANLAGAKITASLTLVGKRPFLFLGPIGSDSRAFHAYITNKGLRLRAGCFFGTRDEFLAKLDAEHGDNEHGREYRAALALIDVHAELWTPVEDRSAAA